MPRRKEIDGGKKRKKSDQQQQQLTIAETVIRSSFAQKSLQNGKGLKTRWLELWLQTCNHHQLWKTKASETLSRRLTQGTKYRVGEQ